MFRALAARLKAAGNGPAAAGGVRLRAARGAGVFLLHSPGILAINPPAGKKTLCPPLQFILASLLSGEQPDSTILA
ncbi:hypothetical protein LJC36_05130 [Desulfovibrio sp. OttesenSCG-928-C14]|nr:hypothetical protein [Desulfovibrio sp. OttesenSCG-928-C14]